MRWLYTLNLVFLLSATSMVFSSGGASPVQLLSYFMLGHGTWFEGIKQYCNPVEVGMAVKRNPPPNDNTSHAYEAACYALAGKINKARNTLDQFPIDQRGWAANIVFNVAHPIADMGDDESAGPIMQLVVDYIPNHFMALYHAGISLYATGHHEDAERNLVRFLKLYKNNDGWRKNAKQVLKRIRSQT